MGFYDYTTGQGISLDSLDFGGVGAPGDSLLIHSGQRCDKVYLPFRDGGSPTVFFIHYDYKEQGLDNPAMNDTLTFHYTTTPYFASSECGAMYIYQVSRVEYTRHLIESLEITDSLITNVERERIKLFFRTSSVSEDEEGDTGDDTPGQPDSPATGDEGGNPGEGEQT